MFAPISFFVPGHPASAGSKKYIHRGDRIVLIDDCSRNASWRKTIQFYAGQAYRHDLIIEPVILGLEFLFVRPKTHFSWRKSGPVLRPDAPPYPDVVPDLTKLVRAVEDALTGCVWRDDASVVAQYNSKTYGEVQGALIRVEPAGEDLYPKPQAEMTNCPVGMT
jgi:Holliday junction resolvase RusA-like endonuclease